MRSFGDMLRNQRQKLRLTQKQVAESVGLSDAYICSLECDKRCPPPYYTVAALADALQLDVEKLWEMASKHRKKRALERSQRKAMAGRRDVELDGTYIQQRAVSDSQINAFFDRPEIQMATLGLFHRQPRDMSMEDKRIVFQAIRKAQESISRELDEAQSVSADFEDGQV